MYRNNAFKELLEALPRGVFDTIVRRTGADKYSKGFKCWDQFVVMVYGQMTGCRSLREIEAGFNAQVGHHYHLGSKTVKRSTLADANAKRDENVYAQVYEYLLASTNRQLKREIGDNLYLLDSTPIPLKGLGYDEWASSRSTHRTQGLKVHMLYQPDQQRPVYSHITAPNINDIEDARQLDLEKGATYVFDKGYCDYNWWHSFEQTQASFVTRFKNNAALTVQETLPVPSQSQHKILSDERVSFKNSHPGGGRRNHYTGSLRRITVWREDGKKPLVLATNDFSRTAVQIADLYKKRWKIELFFKWLKQNLKIKRFFGRSERAVKTQIYIALITYLLVWLHHQRARIGRTLKETLTVMSAVLFRRLETDYAVYRRRKRARQELLDRQGVLL